jgi:8-oxo-dGTP pyrophosphatase MutT (NUDIX family)
VKRYTRDLRPAGVLIPIVERENALSVLLTQRSEDLSRHPGQISFPGGRMENGDANILATALRETQEEIGVPPELIEVAGYLDPSPTVSGFAVTPVIGFLKPDFRLVIDRTEVAYTFEVPLEFLMQERNVRHGEREFDGFRLPVAEFNYGEHRIWGATASFLIMLRKKIR